MEIDREMENRTSFIEEAFGRELVEFIGKHIYGDYLALFTFGLVLFLAALFVLIALFYIWILARNRRDKGM